MTSLEGRIESGVGHRSGEMGELEQTDAKHRLASRRHQFKRGQVEAETPRVRFQERQPGAGPGGARAQRGSL